MSRYIFVNQKIVVEIAKEKSQASVEEYIIVLHKCIRCFEKAPNVWRVEGGTEL